MPPEMMPSLMSMGTSDMWTRWIRVSSSPWGPAEAPDVGEQNQLFRPQGHRQLGGGGVGVDVVGRSRRPPLATVDTTGI